MDASPPPPAVDHLSSSSRTWLFVGSFAGGSQKPMEAKQSQALFSFGQQLGHFFPGVYTGWVPASQKPSSAKHSQEWSLVALRALPGQQAPLGQSHGTLSQPGQIVEH